MGEGYGCSYFHFTYSSHYCSEWVKKGIIGTNAKHAGKMASLNSLS